MILPRCGEDKIPVSDRIAPCKELIASGNSGNNNGSKQQSSVPAAKALSNPALTHTVELPALSARAKSLPLAQTGQPLQVGVGREVARTASAHITQNLLDWQPTATGGYVAALRFVSPGAFGMRLGVLVRELPPGAVLRTYGDARQEVAQITQAALAKMAERNARDADATEQSIHTWWSPTVDGESTTLEVEIPAGADPGRVRISVPQLSHYVVSLERVDEMLHARDFTIGSSDSCHVNAMCSPETDLESRATARMMWPMGNGKVGLCTGTLVNDAGNSATPWFLTANHCISTQAAASGLETYWFFRTSACTSATPNPGRVKRTGGAELLYTTTSPDTTLLRLNEAPPVGVAWAGSYFGQALDLGEALVGVHHPSGDLQKVSTGTLEGFSDCTPAGNGMHSCSTSVNASASANTGYWNVGWQQGVVQPGSSGSGLFVKLNGVHYITGNLSNGSSSCAQPDGKDNYGRFDRVYQSLKQYLNP